MYYVKIVDSVQQSKAQKKDILDKGRTIIIWLQIHRCNFRIVLLYTH